MKTLWLTQIVAVLRLEMRKTFLARRGLWIYLLALMPVVLFAGHSIKMLERRLPCDLAQDTNIFASVFQLLHMRLVVFFGCLGIFMNLFRGEVLDRSLHFYFLAPIRREVLVTGKYLAGLTAAILIFTASTLLQFVAMYAHYTSTTLTVYLRDGNGWSHLGAYLGVTVLACIGYGSVFLLSGALFKNPIAPAGAVLVWESINGFVPSVLQKFSVIYYLKSLCPVEAAPEVGPPLSLLIVNPEPIGAAVAVTGILMVAVLVVIVAAMRVRRMEISYGTEG